jgi:hypothetical protein
MQEHVFLGDGHALVFARSQEKHILLEEGHRLVCVGNGRDAKPGSRGHVTGML